MRAAARELCRAMDDRTLAGQVLMTGIDGKGRLPARSEELLRKYPPGAIMLFKYNVSDDPNDTALFLDECAAVISRAASGVVPFVAVDHEGGLVHRFGTTLERLPSPGSYTELARAEGPEEALSRIETDARRSGAELRTIGITMNLAPVAEILNDDNKTFLEDRSYGRDGTFVTSAGAAFIRGMEDSGIASVLKHFPGNSGSDPHIHPARMDYSRDELNRMVLPFKELIEQFSPAAVMVSHAVVSAADPLRNASLSPEIISDWLKGELGFSGIVLGDDFSMGAVSLQGYSPEEAVIAAINAGIDMVMTWPRNVAAVHGAIITALENGTLSRDRLEDAAERIVFQKMRYGLLPVHNGSAL
ncbi:glycoside hydrolase family 3 N-terminal domain-containing protein [Breznakiella homolactica]|uniref:beta-N-acetylhexosaminidase n=1 Tax=Breznakiella homolactica TaxID=2798577 RepID=A0A7T7XR54_9SPIR|nr:glycoside hydrolase family 3 N-terminal domain-containing protein [Breznakiella homolactica]QQO10929.1 glycoside hydrolase family 3 protein [Breznakiella homolactica]